MAIKASQLMGMDVYTDNAQFVGKVYDIIIDLQKGELVRLTLEPIKLTTKDEAKRIFREKTILYKSVKAVEKIIIVSSTAPLAEPEEPEEEPTPAKQPYSYRYRRHH
ncbi:MAG: PRC-barrel domain-containing protein [Candidatus Micrarchaeia archaeon]